MKNSLKTILFENFEQKIAEAYPDMTEVNRRRIAALMQNVAIDIIKENSDGLADNYSQMCLELETNKKMFREHIESIQKAYKVIFDAFKKNGDSEYGFRPKNQQTSHESQDHCCR